MKKIILIAVAAAGMAMTVPAVADDGSCGDYRPTTRTELTICSDLAKGATSRDARTARKLIENGNITWSKAGREGTCRMTVNASGVMNGNSHSVRATCTVSDPEAMTACVEDAEYTTDVTRCGLEYLEK